MRKRVIFILLIAIYTLMVACGKKDDSQTVSISSETKISQVDEANQEIIDDRNAIPVDEIDISEYVQVIKDAYRIMKYGDPQPEKYEDYLSPEFFYNDYEEYLGYTLCDLNDDGVKELIFGAFNSPYDEGNHIFGIYTIENGKVKNISLGATRYWWRICKNGKLAYQSSSSAFDYTEAYYQFDGTSIALIESIGYYNRDIDFSDSNYKPEDDDNVWYYSETEEVFFGDIERFEHISAAKVKEIQSKYEYDDSLECCYFKDLDLTDEQILPLVKVKEDGEYGCSLIGLNENYGEPYIKEVEFTDSQIIVTGNLYYSEEEKHNTMEMEVRPFSIYVFNVSKDIIYAGFAEHELPSTREETISRAQEYGGLWFSLLIENGEVVKVCIYP